MSTAMERLTRVNGVGEYELIRCLECGPEVCGPKNERCGMCEHWETAIQKLGRSEDAAANKKEPLSQSGQANK